MKVDLQHVFYFNGDATKISWKIKTEESIATQSREHVDMYKNKVTDIQSKYIALHVGLFWGIGVFIIKNEDSITIKIDEEKMYEYLTDKKEIHDEFIKKRTQFIKQLIHQRKLKIKYELLDPNENIAKG